ncbi:MAG: hypothetical protein WBL67_02135 [Nitrososphaeraceae archaeon]
MIAPSPYSDKCKSIRISFLDNGFNDDEDAVTSSEEAKEQHQTPTMQDRMKLHNEQFS